MNYKVILSILLTTLVYEITASLVVIECTFPCSQDKEDVCEVTDTYVRCKQKTNKTKYDKKKKTLPASYYIYINLPLIDGYYKTQYHCLSTKAH